MADNVSPATRKRIGLGRFKWWIAAIVVIALAFFTKPDNDAFIGTVGAEGLAEGGVCNSFDVPETCGRTVLVAASTVQRTDLLVGMVNVVNSEAGGSRVYAGAFGTWLRVFGTY